MTYISIKLNEKDKKEYEIYKYKGKEYRVDKDSGGRKFITVKGRNFLI